MRLVRLALISLLAVSAIMFSGCGDELVVAQQPAEATLSTITVTPATPSVAAGRTQQFSASGKKTDGSTATLTGIQWTSSDTNVATVDANGLATSKTAGTATIRAAVGAVSNTATLTVTAPVLASVSISPLDSSVPVGRKQVYTLTGTMSNATSAPYAELANCTWESSNTNIATISNAMAMTHALGSTTIKVTCGTVSASTGLSVTAAVPDFLTITPADPTVSVGDTLQLDVSARLSNGSSQDVTSTVTWQTTNAAVVELSSTVPGQATAKAEGTARIDVRLEEYSLGASSSVTVTAPEPTGAGVAYVLSTGPDRVASMNVSSTGEITELNSVLVTTGSSFVSNNRMALAPSAPYLYLSFNDGPNTALGKLSLNSAGAIVSGSVTPVPTARQVVQMEMHPTGKYLFTAAWDDQSHIFIDAYAINSQTGELTLTPHSFDLGGSYSAIALAFDSAGDRLYVVVCDYDPSAGTVGPWHLRSFNVNIETSELTGLHDLVQPANIVLGRSIAIDSDGGFLVNAQWERESGLSMVRVYRIAEDGSLSQVSSLNTSYQPPSVIRAANRYVYYGSESRELTVASIDPNSGVITKLNNGPAQVNDIQITSTDGTKVLALSWTELLSYKYDQSSVFLLQLDSLLRSYANGQALAYRAK